jgi:hypothetical protein
MRFAKDQRSAPLFRLLLLRTRSSQCLHQATPLRSRGAFLRPGFCIFCFAHPRRGVGGAPRDVGVLGGAPVARAIRGTPGAERGALRPMTRDARLPALHRGGFWLRTRASVSGIASGIRAASSSQPGLSAWRAGSRASRGERLRAAAAGRHASLRIQDRL